MDETVNGLVVVGDKISGIINVSGYVVLLLVGWIWDKYSTCCTELFVSLAFLRVGNGGKLLFGSSEESWFLLLITYSFFFFDTSVVMWLLKCSLYNLGTY